MEEWDKALEQDKTLQSANKSAGNKAIKRKGPSKAAQKKAAYSTDGSGDDDDFQVSKPKKATPKKATPVKAKAKAKAAPKATSSPGIGNLSLDANTSPGQMDEDEPVKATKKRPSPKNAAVAPPAKKAKKVSLACAVIGEC